MAVVAIHAASQYIPVCVRFPVEDRSSRIQPNRGTTRIPNFAERGNMTTTLVWTGVALWLALNAAVAVRLYAVQPGRATIRPHRGLYRI